MKPIKETIDAALGEFGKEAAGLASIADTRYDRALWPTLGQYDWFCTQVLYCLVRALKPARMVEVSTSSGYSTCITALALKANGGGKLHTFEIAPAAAEAAKKNAARLGVEAFVEFNVGDAMQLARGREELKEASILFLDSLHTSAFMRWFLDAFVVPGREDALFHVHDVLPWDARVRRDGTPGRGLVLDLKRAIYDRFIGGIPASERVRPLVTRGEGGALDTYNGIETLEASLTNELALRMAPGSGLFLHSVARQYTQCEPQRYDAKVIGREDAQGRPFEWNESFWGWGGEVKKAYAAWAAAGSPLGIGGPGK